MNAMLDYMKYETSKSEHKLLSEVKLNENKDFFPSISYEQTSFSNLRSRPLLIITNNVRLGHFHAGLTFHTQKQCPSFICGLWVGSVREMKLTTGTSSQSLMENVPMTTLNA